MKIVVSKDDLRRIELDLNEVKNGATKALVVAINQTGKTISVQFKKAIGSDIALKASRIAKDITVEKANYGKVSGSVKISGKPVGLIHFGARQTKTGVSVKVKKKKGRKIVKSAFISTGRGGALNVWKREIGPNNKMVGRLKIEKLSGPRIPDIAASDEILIPIKKKSADLLSVNIDKQVAAILRRRGLNG